MIKEISSIYKQDLNNLSKLSKIINYISDHYQEIIKYIKKNKPIKNKNYFDHQKYSKLSDLNDSNRLICLMHYVLNSLLIKEDVYYLKLKGQDEMICVKRNIDYYVFLGNKDIANKIMYVYILLYYLESYLNSHLIVGVDFEFKIKGSGRDISLIQINFESNISKNNFIFIVSPILLEEKIMSSLIKLIFENKKIRKIFHGADSLDLPHMFQNMLQNNKKKITKFTLSYIDTRFVCEYYKRNIKLDVDDKCSIYAALQFFKVIGNEKYENLIEINEGTGPKQDRVWNIKELSKTQVLYALYDVLFLKHFYYRMIKTAINNVPIEEKNNVKNIYRHLLYEITQFVILEKKEITDITKKCKMEIDPINNYMIRYNFKHDLVNIKLIDIFNATFKDVIVQNNLISIKLDTLFVVNYFRSPLFTLFKKLIYTNILDTKYKVFINKKNIFEEKLSNEYILDYMKKYKFKYLESIINTFVKFNKGAIYNLIENK